MEDLDKRYQTIVVLWAAMVMNIGVFLVITLVAAPQISDPPPARVLTFVFAAVGTFVAVLSFVIKSKLFRRAVDEQNLLLVQTGVILACAMCEVPVLFGVVEAFAIGGHDHYVLFLIGAIAMLLHFPRRPQLEAASYKTGSTQL